MEVSWMRITEGDEFATSGATTWTATSTAQPTGDGDVTFTAQRTGTGAATAHTFIRDPRDTVFRVYSKQYDMFNC